MAASPLDVVVVRTGTANLASVLGALTRLGATPRLTDDPAEVASAERVVLPGVGAFSAAMEQLRSRGLVAPLASRVASGQALLAICLGMQLLAEGSEESPGVAGLGRVPRPRAALRTWGPGSSARVEHGRAGNRMSIPEIGIRVLRELVLPGRCA